MYNLKILFFSEKIFPYLDNLNYLYETLTEFWGPIYSDKENIFIDNFKLWINYWNKNHINFNTAYELDKYLQLNFQIISYVYNRNKIDILDCNTFGIIRYPIQQYNHKLKKIKLVKKEYCSKRVNIKSKSVKD